MDGKTFTDVVRPILVERKIKKGTFCKAVGVSPNMWANWERGSEPRLSVVLAAGEFLGISFSDIIENKNPAPDLRGEESYSQLELIKLLPELTLDEYSRILAYAKERVADRKSQDAQE